MTMIRAKEAEVTEAQGHARRHLEYCEKPQGKERSCGRKLLANE